MNILKIIQLYTLKQWILWYVNHILIKKNVRTRGGYLYRLRHTLHISALGQTGITGDRFIFLQTAKKLGKIYETTILKMTLNIMQKGQYFLREVRQTR